MSKRKREIKKRKKLLEESQAEENLHAAEPLEDAEQPEDSVPAEPHPDEYPTSEPPIDDSQIVSAPPVSAEKKPVVRKETPKRQPKPTTATDSWLGQNKENFLLGLLILYVLLLGLGTVGELFEIEWILNLPLFR